MKPIDRLFKEATGFHKTTCLLASKYSGVRFFDADKHQPFPMLYRRDDGTIFRATIRDHEAEEDWTVDSDSYYTALVVNGAFSLELHLKYLHLLIEEKEKRGHDLFKLHQELCNWTQVNLESIFQVISKSQPSIKQCFDAINEELEGTQTWTLESVLKESARAFESWRYAYEEKTKVTSFVGYGEAIFALRIIGTQFTQKGNREAHRRAHPLSPRPEPK